MVDKQALYGEFIAGQKWRQKLAEKLTYKAVDVPEDVGVQISNTRGFGWKEIVAAGVFGLSGLIATGGMILGGLWMFNQSKPAPVVPPVVPPVQAAPVAPEKPAIVDGEFDLLFFNGDDGSPIRVERRKPSDPIRVDRVPGAGGNG